MDVLSKSDPSNFILFELFISYFQHLSELVDIL